MVADLWVTISFNLPYLVQPVAEILEQGLRLDIRVATVSPLAIYKLVLLGIFSFVFSTPRFVCVQIRFRTLAVLPDLGCCNCAKTLLAGAESATPKAIDYRKSNSSKISCRNPRLGFEIGYQCGYCVAYCQIRIGFLGRTVCGGKTIIIIRFMYVK